MATLNALVRLDQDGRWHLLARGGIEKDINVQFALTGASGSLGATLSSRLGYFSELGLMYGQPNHLGVGMTLRLSGVQLISDMQEISATNFGFGISVYYSYGSDKNNARAR